MRTQIVSQIDLREGASLAIASLLLLVLPGCGPVIANDCYGTAGADHTVRMRGTLTNRTPKFVKHVGVLVGATEYEFYNKLAPSRLAETSSERRMN